MSPYPVNTHRQSKCQTLFERKTLRRYLIGSTLITVMYGVYDSFMYSYNVVLHSVASLVLFALGYAYVRYAHGSLLSRRIVIFIFMVVVASGFLFHGGLLEVTSLDMCCLLVTITIVSSGKERRVLLTLYIFEILLLVVVQLYFSAWIIYDRSDDHQAFNIVEVLVRMLNMLSIGLLYKSEFEKERTQAITITRKLKQRNAEVSRQSELIAVYNDQLKVLLEERTVHIDEMNKRMIEYSFINAHKVRGPLARILGLMNLIKIDPESNTYKECYLHWLEDAAIELDGVLKEAKAQLESVDQPVKLS